MNFFVKLIYLKHEIVANGICFFKNPKKTITYMTLKNKYLHV